MKKIGMVLLGIVSAPFIIIYFILYIFYRLFYELGDCALILTGIKRG